MILVAEPEIGYYFQPQNMTNHFLGATFALITAVSWAAGVILFKKSSDSMSPFALNFFKNAVAVGLFALTFLALGEPLWQVGWEEDLFWLMFSGVVGIGIGDVLFFRSLSLLGAGRSAVVETLYSPAVTVSAFLLLGETLHFATALGGGLIMAGILVIVTAKPESGPDKKLTQAELIDGVLTGVVSVVAMGISIVAVKPILEQHSVLWATSMRLSGGLLAMVVALPFVPAWRKEAVRSLLPCAAWRYAVPGAFFGTYIALFAWIGGFKFTSAMVASFLNQTSTLFIVAGATLFLGERLTRRRVGAVALALTGSILVLATAEEEPVAAEPVKVVRLEEAARDD
ncbi:MAG: DMT family transporter [Myxococcota bacterium]